MAIFTQQQEEAIYTHDKNLIVVAGAGSGKTRVLVERYLDLLDKNRNWRLNAIVAITFTREAAFEMRHRVRQELENRVQIATNESERRHWSSLLAQMDSARIDTIHGMCATILRANAAAAQVDPTFDVLEPIEASSLLNDIIDAELQALADDDADNVAPLFTEYDMRDIRASLSNQALLAIDLSQFPDDPIALYRRWCQEWESAYHLAVQGVIYDLNDALTWSPDGILPEQDKLTTCFQAIDHWWDIFVSEDASASIDACREMISAIDLRGGSTKNWGSKEKLAQAKEVLGQIRDRLKTLLSDIGNPPAELDQYAAEMLVRWYHLLRRIQIAYKQMKAREGYLDFNDLEQDTAKLLSQNQAVRERYQGNEFKRLLVDEFQDTNQAQWDIVRHLANLSDDLAMFLVGDPKQSIYAFRGADVSVFDRVRQQVGEHPNGVELDLTVSFRSHPGLIDAFNKLFSQILSRNENSPVSQFEIAFDKPMSASRQQLPDENTRTYSPIEFLIQRNYPRSSDGFISSEERRAWEAHEIGKRLMQLRADKAPVHNKETDTLKAFDYGDTAILFQSTSSIITYEQIFKSMGIPFVTVAGRGYYHRQEVWDVLNVLKALHNPSDSLSLAAALRSPMFGFSDEMLLALRLIYEKDKRKPIPLWDALQLDEVPHLTDEQINLMHTVRDILYDLRKFAGRITISELLRNILARTGYLATLTGLAGGARLRRNVEKLVDIAERSGKITLGAFSHYLDDLTSSEVREGEATLDTDGVVRLMTVHASKGLEFPIVVLADAGWKKRGGSTSPILYDRISDTLACKIFDNEQSQYVESFPYRRAMYLQEKRDEAERKRLLYVAATRARDGLIISGEMRQRKSGEWSCDGWLQTITETIGLADLDAIQDGHRFDYTPSTQICINLPDYNPDIIKALLGSSTSKWQPVDAVVETEMPRLMQAIEIQSEKMLGHIAATQLANIGGYHYADDVNAQEYYRTSVRRHVLDDASAQIREAMRTRNPRIRPRQLGEVVHEALRYWRFPKDHHNIDQILYNYAWQQNITDEYQIHDVVKRAHRMLEKFQTSDIYRAISVVREQHLPYFAELPFILRTDKRIIHGVIDAVFQYQGEWWLVDFKTSTVKGGLPNVEAHARRYYLQVGAYASAVRQELNGLTPHVFIHYIQYNRTVEIPSEIWEAEISKLENYIGELIGESHD